MNNERKKEYLINVIKAFLQTSIALMKYLKANAKTKEAKEVCQKSIESAELAIKQLPKFKHIEILDYLFGCFIGNNAIAYSVSGKIVTADKLLEYDDDEHIKELIEEMETQKKKREESIKQREENLKTVKKAKEEGKKVEMVWDKETKTVKPMIIEEKPNA